MTRAAALRESVKATFYPFALSRGFVRGKATSMSAPFRRTRGATTHVFDIQWDKYGRPRFVINFGEAPATGVTFAGALVAPDELEASHCPLHGRLQRWRGGSMRTWFQLSKPWAQTFTTLQWEYAPEEVTAQVIACFSELEAWWENKHEGAHVYIWRSVA